jgi:DNA recombination protein RmuC
MLLTVAVGASTLSAIFALLAFIVARRRSDKNAAGEEITSLLRGEFDRLRNEGAEQARGVRQELADNLRGFQATTLQSFTGLGGQLGTQIREFGNRLDSGMRVMDERGANISTTLNQELERLFQRATQSSQALEKVIRSGLDDSAVKAATAARDSREEFSRVAASLQDSLATHLSTTRGGAAQQAVLLRTEIVTSLKQSSDAMIGTLTQLSSAQREHLAEFATRLVEFSATTRTELESVGEGIHQDLLEIRNAGTEHAQLLRQEVSTTIKDLRDAQEALRVSVEKRLDMLRTESASKLDEMRRTVDEKLHTTLEKRLGESFRTVTEQLERVYQGLGEMQSLAAGVGDLKRVLSNVKVRGTWGEIQLGSLLEQFLAPDQYQRNVQIRQNSSERVEFAIRLPGRDGEHEVWLPIDAKFPQEDYERLTIAAENGDAKGVEQAGAALVERIKGCARSIREKYIDPPITTDIAILFLPTESLYAEILRRPGVFENLQREYHVTLAGPTTLTAILNALQMGFRSLAIEKRTSEVWQVLGAIKSEFGRYGEVVDRLQKQLSTAVTTVDTLGTRARAMTRKLREVEVLPEPDGEVLLGIDRPDANGSRDVSGVAESKI